MRDIRQNGKSSPFTISLFFAIGILIAGLAVLAAPPYDPLDGSGTKSREPIRNPETPFEPLYLVSGTFSPSEENSLKRASFQKINEAGPYFFVQLAGPIRSEWTEGLESAGAKIYGYIPNYAYLVKLSPEAAETVKNLDYVVWMGPFEKKDRIHPRASGLQDLTGPDAKNPNIRQDLLVSAFPDVDFKVLVGKLSQPPMTVLDGTVGEFDARVRVSVPRATVQRYIDQIASIPDVTWVDVMPEYGLLNTSGRWVIQTNVSGSTTIWDKGIHGEGQIVGIGDTGIDYDMCFFRDSSQSIAFSTSTSTPNNNHRKVIFYECLADCKDNNSSGHGTHVSGSVAGEDIFSTQGANNGMAYKAKIYFQDIGNTSDSLTGIPSSLETSYFPNARNRGARIHSNSWGSPSNAYSAHSRDVDSFMWSNKDFLVLFAAGNSGSSANRVGEPGTCKNCITVGATDSPTTSGNQNNMADFSSHGPAADGRIKPDVSAPGNQVRSADSDGSTTSNNCATLLMPGTSMATPTVAGGAALVRQYYSEGWYPTGTKTAGNAITPSAALMKATIVNSCRNMTGSYTANTGSGAGSIPTNGQGWGRVTLEDALFFSGDARKLVVWDNGSASTGGTWTQTVTVAAGQALKVTLAWTDYPSTTTASINLVNDLDLEVVTPASVTYLGNVFSGGFSATGGTADRKNPLEQVFINAPAAGTYTIRVKGFNVPQGPQPFAVVVTGDVSTGGAPPPTTYSISGTVTSGGSGVSGVAMSLTGAASQSTSTDASGNYSFSGLANGSYTVTPSKSGWSFTPTSLAVSISGANKTAQNFTGSFSPGKQVLFVDDDGGKAFESYFTAAIQAAGRTYDVWNVSTQGSPDATTMKAYPVVVWNTGAEYSSTLTAADETALQSFLDAKGKLFLSSQDYLYERGASSTFETNYLKLSSYTNDQAPTSQAGVAGDPITNGMNITLSFPSGFTNYADSLVPAAGATSIFTNSKGASGAVKVDPGSSYKAVFLAFPFEAIPTGANPNNRETLMKNALDWLTGSAPPPATYSISGVAIDGASNPLSGVTISWSGAASGSTSTNASGQYTISGLANGSYTVTPSKSGYTFSPVNRAVSVSGANVTGQNFTGTATVVTYSISGTVSGAIASGVTMNLTGAASASTTTDASGNYSFSGLANGSYTVTPSKSGYTFSPVNRAVSVSGANVTGQNFTSTASSSATLLTSGVGVNDSVTLGQEKHYYIVVPSGATQLEVKTTNATGDVDLYVKFGSQPTQSVWDFRPYTSSGNETVTVTTSTTPPIQAGNWYIMVHGYAAGSYTLTATVTTAATQLIANGGFESGTGSWTQTIGYTGTACFNFVTNATSRNGTSGTPRTGTWQGWLGGYDGANDHLYQQVTIPSGATKAELRFWTKLVTTETTTTTNYDWFYAEIRNTSNTVLQTLVSTSNLATPKNSWVERVYDLTSYKGQTIRVYFRATNDDNSGSPVSGDCADVSYKPTHFWVDDVSLISQ